MQKMMMFMKRKEGISFEEFRQHYEEVHIPLCAKWIGHLIVDFKRFYPAGGVNFYVGRPDADEAPIHDHGVNYDAISVYSVKNEAALAELLRIAQDPEFAQAVTDDEANFVDRVVSRQALTEETTGPGLI